MCGRYTLHHAKDIGERFNAEIDFTIEDNYNIAPGFIMPTVSRNSPNKVVLRKWGLVPGWAKDPNIGYKMINARAETVREKPSFRSAFKHKRCLVPARGFYEWDRKHEGKQPYYFKLKDEELFAFAGLYEEWKDAEGKVFETYTIITTSPNSLLETIHDRMPVILHKEDEDNWLDKTSSEENLEKLLKPYSAREMEQDKVSEDVNTPRNNSPELIKPDTP